MHLACVMPKKNECFFKIYIVCFLIYHSWPTWSSTARFSIQFSRVIFDISFSQDNLKNLPNEVGQENFLYCIVSRWSNYFKLWLRKEFSPYSFCGEEMTFCPEQISLIFSPLFLICFSYTDKNDYNYYQQQLTSSGIHLNEQEREGHIKQNKICERLLLSSTNTYFFG